MGAWIETLYTVFTYCTSASHPYMGAWIETPSHLTVKTAPNCRTLTWVRGLKHCEELSENSIMMVAPLHGCVDWNDWFVLHDGSSKSHPYMGAWIETHNLYVLKHITKQSHPYMGAWIETFSRLVFSSFPKSHPYMGAWIETSIHLHALHMHWRRTLTWVRGLKRSMISLLSNLQRVAPLHGCVDWNFTR